MGSPTAAGFHSPLSGSFRESPGGIEKEGEGKEEEGEGDCTGL